MRASDDFCSDYGKQFARLQNDLKDIDPKAVKSVQDRLVKISTNLLIKLNEAAMGDLERAFLEENAAERDLATKPLRILRLLPTDSILQGVVSNLISRPFTEAFPLISTILQYTDAFNMTLLNHLVQNRRMVPGDLLSIARAIDAQPYLAQAWDLSHLLKPPSSADFTSSLHRYIADCVLQHPTTNTVKSIVRLNCREEYLRKEKLFELLQIVDPPCHPTLPDSGDLIATEYLLAKAYTLLRAMQRDVFGHCAVSGPPGCGKMSLIQLTHQLHQRQMGNNDGFIVVTLEEQFDSKNLVGTYVCNETGEFVFKKGPLTVAAEKGLWLVLRNIEDTPSDLLSFLMPLIQENVLNVTSTFSIRPKLGFRIFACQREQSQTGRHEDIQPLLALLTRATLEDLPSRPDFTQILERQFPALFLPTKDDGITVHNLLQDSIGHLWSEFSAARQHLLDFRHFSITQLFSVYRRVNACVTHSEGDQEITLSQGMKQVFVEELCDVYLGYLYDHGLRAKLIESLVEHVFNKGQSLMDPTLTSSYICELPREHGISPQSCSFGRVTLPRNAEDYTSSTKFVYTGCTVRLVEQICQGVSMNEPLLLVGETGTGKTTAVQELAALLGKKLHVLNMNQNTDSADLLGGFKPVDAKFLLKPIYERFLSLFKTLITSQSTNNADYLTLLQNCYTHKKVREFAKCLAHGYKSIQRKMAKVQDMALQEEAAKLQQSIVDLQKRAQKLESGGGFIFQFIEGTLFQSIQNGEWILLDEINLAQESVLNRLATIVQGEHILLNERADIVETKRHPDFRLFMCMNPPYTSAGKKQLPASLREKFLELYVNELENESDLWQIVDRNTQISVQRGYLNEEQKRKILEFYMTVRTEIAKQTKRGNIGLRNLCRSLHFINSAVSLQYHPLKAIYDSLCTCFASHLDPALQDFVKTLIVKLFKITKLPGLKLAQESEKYACIQDSIIPFGDFPPQNFDPNNFVLTPSFKKLLRQLASVVAVSDFAVILEGPTSAGKTSCIQYLAAATHNKVIRINNHMHTDVQEYVGSYVPDTEAGGKLVFREGALVEAVRHGYWVILDELNLAPSEVLEALNRLLDDNREVNIIETQQVIKAHPRFRIFATQNPTEGYGGRKELSEAFKNRFVLIRVADVPTDELEEILVKKCDLPPSRASLMVKTMEALQIYRSQTNLFSGKNSVITVRDLLKWAGRITKQHDVTMTDQVALEGFFVLAERSRSESDKAYIKETIEKIFRLKIDEHAFYESYFAQNLANIFEEAHIKNEGIPRVIASQQLKRLAVLVYKCLLNREPVLLVGETGVGKTVLCQVFATAVTQLKLFAINCHQNTETSDFIGSMRTRKNLLQTQEQLSDLVSTFPGTSLRKRALAAIATLEDPTQIQTLLDDLSCVFEWHDGILIEAMEQGGLLLIDEISLANDSVLERLNSVFEYDRTLVLTEKQSVSGETIKIEAHEQFNMVATMNPSGDFGKKELSPALRNRMTEIWVESYFGQSQLQTLYKDSSVEMTMPKEVSTEVDLFLIVKKICENKKLPEPIPHGIFTMICFMQFPMAKKYFALHRKALSIRDILAITEFLEVHSATLSLKTAFIQAVELVIIDGVCLGIDVASKQEEIDIVADCRGYLAWLSNSLFTTQGGQISSDLVNSTSEIGVGPYTIAKDPTNISMAGQQPYVFEAGTTKFNLLKLLRAFSLDKPILIEGAPGVGKTSLVENLAKQCGKTLVRVNLSEQTDMMDLLGSEYPTSTPNDDSDDETEIQFSWCDGVLLRAIKAGHWFLIDEMNLAQQSILEGLNAILDHRRTVYIPELGQEFRCHPDFFVFACQNPSQSSQGTSGRKTLPKSFMNRFTKIFLEELTQDDYRMILKHQASDLFTSPEQIDSLLQVTKGVESLLNRQGCVNMRDISRFSALCRQFGAPSDKCLLQALETCYFMRLGTQEVVEAGLELPYKCGLLAGEVQRPVKTSSLRFNGDKATFSGLIDTEISLSSSQAGKRHPFSSILGLKGEHTKSLKALCDCMQAGFPLLIVTNEPFKFQESLATLATLQNRQLKRILLNERTDTTQLLGCFEQTSQDLSSVLGLIWPQSATNTTQLRTALHWTSTIEEQLVIVKQFVQDNRSALLHLDKILTRLDRVSKGASHFEWVDSVLVSAIEHGHWAVFENANLCNPSVLDRLNSLLEDGNQSLSMNEQGLVGGEMREVKVHPEFRAIFVLTQKTLVQQGKDISRALRNRCLEIEVNFYAEEDESPLAQSIVSSPGYMQQISELQVKFDLHPAQLDYSPPVVKHYEQSKLAKLGKRKSEDQPTLPPHDLTTLTYPQLAAYRTTPSLDARMHYLCLLVQWTGQWSQLREAGIKDDYIKASVDFIVEKAEEGNIPDWLSLTLHHLRETVKDKATMEILPRYITALLQTLTAEDRREEWALVDLLASVTRQGKSLHAMMGEPSELFLLSQLEIEMPADFLIEEELRFLTDPRCLQTLREQMNNLLQPNQLSESQISACLSHQRQAEQLQGLRIFLYKATTNFTNFPSPAQFLLQQISEQTGATILMLGEDKELLSTSEMVQALEQQDDQRQLLESAFILVIPAKAEAVVFASQSYLYESLCLVKDYQSLDKSHLPEHLRLTHLPALLPHLQNEYLDVVTTIYRRNLPQLHGIEDLGARTLEAILTDEQTVSLRDLPAFLAVGNSLLYKLPRLVRGEATQELAGEWKGFEEVNCPSEVARSHLSTAGYAITTLESLATEDIIRAMFVLPMECERQKSGLEHKQNEIDAILSFNQYQLRLADVSKLDHLVAANREEYTALEAEYVHLCQFRQRTQQSQYRELKPLLGFVASLKQAIGRAVSATETLPMKASANHLNGMVTHCLTVEQLLLNGCQQFFTRFNHVLCEFFASALLLTQSLKNFAFEYRRCHSHEPRLCHSLVSLHLDELRLSKYKLLNEMQFLFSLKVLRLTGREMQDRHEVFEYFVRREIAARILAEDKVEDFEQVFKAAVKVREQLLRGPKVGKAMDEWTKEDKAIMEKEAQEEIEVNFPSYFNEFQRELYSAETVKDKFNAEDARDFGMKGLYEEEVPVQDMLAEVLKLQESKEDSYLEEFLKCRLQIVQSCLASDQQYQTAVRYGLPEHLNDHWGEDACGLLAFQLSQKRLRSIMNIADIELPSAFNFYYSSLAQECRLVYKPLAELQIRLRDITITDGYESPLLFESMFLSNYMLTSFNAQNTPLMKLLTGLELLLNKLEEWEKTYASKRLNSVEENINALKQLVIRYRKIQILSWRNLLRWRKEKMVNEDMMDYIRLAHTVERQVFDLKMYKQTEENVELKLLELLDLFMRDSSLGVYKSRLNFIQYLSEFFASKQVTKPRMVERYKKLKCILNFIVNYYAQFEPKLVKTIERLDAKAREKVTTLIDVGKWTVQKFSNVKNNIDKVHRQLNKACKQEEEALMQNVQSLVLASSRKKYHSQNDQLLSLDAEENKPRTMVVAKMLTSGVKCENSLVKQLEFFERHKIVAGWPDINEFQNVMNGFFERMSNVRALNKKNFQRRAFVDLLRYFKEQGLRQNFQKDIQPLLMSTEVKSEKYFYKAYEAFMMLRASGQTDDQADLKNVDIMRIQSFSQNLMHAILAFNVQIEKTQFSLDQLRDSVPLPANGAPGEPLTHFKAHKVATIRQKFTEEITGMTTKLSIQNLIKQGETMPIHPFQELESELRLHGRTMCVDTRSLATLEASFDKLDLSMDIGGRTDAILQASKAKIAVLRESVAEVLDAGEVGGGQDLTEKRVCLIEKKVKLLYQQVYKLLQDQQDDEKKEGENVMEGSDIRGQTTEVTAAQDAPDLNIPEHILFSKSLNEKILPFCEQVSALSKNLFALKGVSSSDFEVASLDRTNILLQKAVELIQFTIKAQTSVLNSLSKLSYCTQRVFLYLIYQGFCGEEDDSDDNNDNQEELEQDGQGLGDGGGGRENITDQIEHEEQLEGLKNYESEDENRKEEEQQEEKDKEDEKSDFEMKEDFDDGQMEDEERDEDKKSDQNEDDQMDDVDEMLDNQLWDRNMEDMQQKEEENNEEQKDKEKDEIDLGERNLDEQNLLEDQESNMDGNDEKDEDKEMKEAEEKPEKDKKEGEEAQASEEEKDDEKSGSEDEEEGSNKNDLPLDIESQVNESVVSSEEVEEGRESSDGEESQSQSDSEDPAEGNDQGEDQSISEDQSEHESGDNIEQRKDQQPEDHGQDEKDQAQVNEDMHDEQEVNFANQQQNENKKQEKQEQQKSKQEEKMDSQKHEADSSGQIDLLFNMAQQFKQKQQEKKEKKEQQQKAEKEDPAAPQLDRQNQVEKDEEREKGAKEDDQAAADDNMQFEMDSAADMQGKLATDQVQGDDEEEQPQMLEPSDEHNSNGADEEMEEAEQDENIERTKVQADQNKDKQQKQNKRGEGQEKSDEEEKAEEEEEKVDFGSLIDKYQGYLDQKKDMMEVEKDQKMEYEEVQTKLATFTMSIDAFDYAREKSQIRELFEEWCRNTDLHRQSLELLGQFKMQTAHVSASLCEQLRIVLEPQLSQNLQGDFKTGKRLNMKKVISFIASHYRNDKIWLRRTLPSKRDYKILVAIDDSLSMQEHGNLGLFSLESMVALTEALQRLEVGQVAVARIRDRLELLQSFEDHYSAERAGFIVSQFGFQHHAATSADHSMANFVRDANQLLDTQNSGTSSPFVIILSDGRFNKENVRKYLRESREKHYLYIFVILDKTADNDDNGNVMNRRQAVKTNKGYKLVPYLNDFPFDYYCVIRDIQQLPAALGTILVQWFSMVSGQPTSQR